MVNCKIYSIFIEPERQYVLNFFVSVFRQDMRKKTASFCKKRINYYPFGMTVPGRNDATDGYRYGFQGEEKDDEIKGEGNSINYKYRMHDPRVGRFFAPDPLEHEYPWNSAYAFSENRLLDAVELEGLEASLGLNILRNGLEGEGISVVKTNDEWQDSEYTYTHKYQTLEISDNVNIHNGLRSNDSWYNAAFYGDAYILFANSNNAKNLAKDKEGGIYTMAYKWGARQGIDQNVKYEIDGKEYGDGHLGYTNTYRHVLFSSTFTILYGESFAKVSGDVHERDNLAGGEIDTTSDIINNAWGRELGKKLKKDLNLPSSGRWTNQQAADYLNAVSEYIVNTFPELSKTEYKVDDEDVKAFAKAVNKNNNSGRVTTCFVKGTKVLLSNGNEKNIEEIKEGDRIMSVNIDNMKIEEDVVLELPKLIKKYRKIYAKFSNEIENYFSPAHPFWVVGKGWSVFDLDEAEIELNFKVSKLEEGDKLLFYKDGVLTEVVLEKLIDTGEKTEMYNVENVKKNHSFFANGILVHNKFID